MEKGCDLIKYLVGPEEGCELIIYQIKYLVGLNEWIIYLIKVLCGDGKGM